MAPQSWRVATQLLIGVLLCAPVRYYTRKINLLRILLGYRSIGLD